MKVLHLCDSAIGRVLKEAYVTQSLKGVTSALWYGHGSWAHRAFLGLIHNQSIFASFDQLIHKIKQIGNNFDVIHFHSCLDNETWIERIREHYNGAIVWDMHDTVNDIPGPCKYVDAMIVPSDGYKQNVISRNCIDADRIFMIYSMVPKIFFPKYTEKRNLINAGVLVSGIQMPGGDKLFRDYTFAQQGLSEQIFILPGENRMEFQRAYHNLMQTAEYGTMLDILWPFSFGYAGASNDRHSIHDCMTNKFFEYIAAGLPVVSFRSDEMSEFCRRYWVGAQLDSIDEPLPLTKWAEDRSILLKARQQFTMESQLPGILTAYREAIKHRKENADGKRDR